MSGLRKWPGLSLVNGKLRPVDLSLSRKYTESVTDRPVRLSLIRPKYTRSTLPSFAGAKNSSPLAATVPANARTSPSVATERNDRCDFIPCLVEILHEPAPLVDQYT